MRYGTDCIRPKSPVYTSETERYGSKKKTILDRLDLHCSLPRSRFCLVAQRLSSRNGCLHSNCWVGTLRDETKTAAKETSLNVTRFVPKKVHSLAHFVL